MSEFTTSCSQLSSSIFTLFQRGQTEIQLKPLVRAPEMTETRLQEQKFCAPTILPFH